MKYSENFALVGSLVTKYRKVKILIDKKIFGSNENFKLFKFAYFYYNHYSKLL